MQLQHFTMRNRKLELVLTSFASVSNLFGYTKSSSLQFAIMGANNVHESMFDDWGTTSTNSPFREPNYFGLLV